jgi:thiamine kinase-like enzyme
MPPSDVQRLAEAYVPGSGDIHLTRMGAGLESETYRVRRDGALYALKFNAEGSESRSLQRRFEALVLASAAPRGLAPPLLATDPDGRIMVLEWLAGTPMSEATAGRPDAALAKLLRGVHALPLPALRRVMSPRAWIEHYDEALAAQGTAPMPELARRAVTLLAQLGAQPCPDLCVCHSDLHRLNVLVRGEGAMAGALVLLDWEYSHLSEPFWDLAGWSANNDLGPAARAMLLAAYQERTPASAELERLSILVWLYDYVCLQWMRLYVARRREAGASYAARAAILERRLKAPVYGTIAVPTDF